MGCIYIKNVFLGKDDWIPCHCYLWKCMSIYTLYNDSEKYIYKQSLGLT